MSKNVTKEQSGRTCDAPLMLSDERRKHSKMMCGDGDVLTHEPLLASVTPV
jgi:hypothetical protein